MHRSKLVLALLATLALALAASQSYADTLTTLAVFNSTDPVGSLTLSGSTLYGTTQYGGTNGLGTVFSIPVTGGTPTTLLSFNGTNGKSPTGDLALSGSTLYGMTYLGGDTSLGTVFSVPVTGGTATTLVSFNGVNGEYPQGNLLLSGSTLYGTAGTIFSIPVTGGNPTTVASVGATSLTLNGSTLYGMTTNGGADNIGTVFSVPVTGGNPTTLFSFNDANGYPLSNSFGSFTLSGSTLYGMTSHGGANDEGVIFSVPVTGGTPTVLFSSFDGTNGENPYGGLTLVGSTLYGMTTYGGANGDGTIFSIPTTGGPLTTVVSFNGTNGSDPLGDLTLSADGKTLYGATQAGGANGGGNVFALSLATPEPSSVVLLGVGAIGLGAAALRRRMRKQAA